MQLTIEKLIYGGDGLSRLPADEHGRGKAVFLPFVLPGEEVEASVVEERPGFARARTNNVLKSAVSRIAPRCPYFQRCGGCHYQHAAYEHQLEIKSAVLRENLRRIAKLELETGPDVHPSPAWNYRNRARLKVQNTPEFAVGYHGFGSHQLLPVRQCPISSPLINQAIDVLWQVGKVAEGVLEVELFANADDTKLLAEAYVLPDVGLEGLRQWTEGFQQAMPEIAGIVTFRAVPISSRSAPERVTALGAEELSYTVGTDSYRVSAGAFFQINRYLTDELVDLVTAGHTGQIALDLYAGVGLFAKSLARNFAQVTAVEPSPISHRDLLYNLPANVKAVRATTEQHLKAAGHQRPDLIVVDPPRSGLGERVIRDLVRLRAPQLTYVSCDPATLARDLRALLASGYRVEMAHLVDLFPQTYHLECVFHLVR